MRNEEPIDTLQANDVVLVLPDQPSISKARSFCTNGTLQYVRRLRCWVYRRSNKSPLPPDLLHFLPRAPYQLGNGRTYLSYKGRASTAPHPELRWDPAYLCWYFPAAPDFLPSSLLPFKPKPFSWPAWCQQQCSPILSPCTAPASADEPNDDATLLADEIFRAARSHEQPGFLYLRPFSGQRTFDIWSAILRVAGEHSTNIVVVCAEHDEALWRSVIAFCGTGPATAVVLPYSDLHYIAPKARGTGRCIVPCFLHSLRPHIIIWDNSHLLNSTQSRRKALATEIAEAADFNIWASDCPAARPADITLIKSLLEGRGPTSAISEAMKAPSERWLTWRGPVAQRPVSALIRNYLFERDHMGILGGLTAQRPPNTVVEFRPITANETLPYKFEWDCPVPISERSIENRAKQSTVADIAVTSLHEGTHCCIVSSDESTLQALYEVLDPLFPTALFGSGNQEHDIASIGNSRCVLISPAFLRSLPPPTRGASRVVLFTALPLTLDDFATIAVNMAPRTTYVFPYFVGTSEAEIVRSIPMKLVNEILNQSMTVSIERY